MRRLTTWKRFAILMAVGALVALGGATTSLLASTPGTNEAAGPTTDLTVHFTSSADRSRTLHVKESDTGRTLHKADLHLQSDATLTIEVAVPTKRLIAEIGGEGILDGLLDDGTNVTVINLDPRGCQGAFQAAIHVARTYASLTPQDTGCRAGASRLVAILRDAEDATPIDDVSVPRTAPAFRGDEARYRTTDHLLPDAEEDWQAWSILATNRTTMSGRHGETWPAVSFDHVRHEPGRAVPGGWRHEAWFALDGYAPLATSRPADRYGPATALESPDPLLTARDRVGTDPWPACLLRHGLQGPSAGANPAPFACSHDAVRWQVDAKGPLLVLYGVAAVPPAQGTDGDLAFVVTIDSAVPYPVHAERFRLEAGLQRHETVVLDAYAQGAGPALLLHETAERPPGEPPAPQRIDALYGPSLDEAGDRIPVTLRRAVDTARADPRTAPLLAGRDDLVLAGAAYRVHEVNGFSARSTHAWGLRFTDPAGAGTSIVCTFAPPIDTLPSPLHGALAPGTCEATDGTPTELAWIGHPPPLGPRNVPFEGASFDAAIEAWDRLGGNGRRVDLVGYRVWDHGTAAEDRAGLLVGTRSPTTHTDDQPPDVAQVMVSLYDAALISERYSSEFVEPPAEGARPYEPPALHVTAAGVPVPFSDTAVNSAAVGTGVAIVGALGLRWLVPWLLARTRNDSDALGNPVRQRLFTFIREHPGIRRQELRRKIGCGNAQLEHHIAVLQAGRYVHEVREGIQRFFFPGGQAPTRDLHASVLLNDATRRRLFELIGRRPGTTISELAALGGIDISQASRVVTRLENVGLVRRRRAGRNVTVWPNR